MGVEASFSVDKDVRKHAGFSVHRWKTATSMTETADGNPLPAGFMEGWMRGFHISHKKIQRHLAEKRRKRMLEMQEEITTPVKRPRH